MSMAMTSSERAKIENALHDAGAHEAIAPEGFQGRALLSKAQNMISEHGEAVSGLGLFRLLIRHDIKTLGDALQLGDWQRVHVYNGAGVGTWSASEHGYEGLQSDHVTFAKNIRLKS